MARAMMQERFARTLLLFEQEGFAKLQKTKILIAGLGGVGSFALDCLYRTGIGTISILDSDCFELSNQNRQIGAFEGVGQKKVKVLHKLYPNTIPIDARLDLDFIQSHDLSQYDFVLDCIDDIPSKILLAQKIAQAKRPILLSSTGSAKKLDPGLIQCASIWKSYGDRFARKLREGLKKQQFRGDFKVVFSPEPPKCKSLGSFSAVTASFGLRLASEMIKEILKDKK